MLDTTRHRKFNFDLLKVHDLNTWKNSYNNMIFEGRLVNTSGDKTGKLSGWRFYSKSKRVEITHTKHDTALCHEALRSRGFHVTVDQ